MLNGKIILFLTLTFILGLRTCSLGLTVTQVDAGGSHTVALKEDGTVWVWGNNNTGQLGDGTTTRRITPVKISSLSGVTAIAAGGSHTVALRGGGTVWTWGSNGSGQLGDGTTVQRTTPVQVSSLSGVTAITAGSSYTVALKGDGTVWAWGKNFDGQLGDGTLISKATPVQVLGLTGITAIAAGEKHTVALKSDGTVWTWGYNGSGQLGDGTTAQRTTPVQVSSLSGVTAIAVGNKHTVALKSDGFVWVWGENEQGQLGDGTTTRKTTPVQVTGLAGVTAIAAGYNHTVALKSDGIVWTWGYNYFGQLGDGTDIILRRNPVQVLGLSGVTAIAAGSSHNVALKSDGTIWAWGYNLYSQLGNGACAFKYTAVQVPGFSGASAITAGHDHTVALKNDGTVWTWGDNYYGQLGDGTFGTTRSTPLQVQVLAGVTAITAGRCHTVALKSDGTVWTWGDNYYGQLGDGTNTYKTTHVQVLGLSGVIAIAAGEYHTVALKSDGTVWAWGDNYYGQLGGYTYPATTSSTPVLCPGLTGVTAIAAGRIHTVALNSDGTVWGWGSNDSGQLGVENPMYYPVHISGLSGVTSIAAGSHHTVALKSDGTVRAWGWNSDGQIGDGTTITRYTPVQVLGLTGVTAIAAGYYHTMALKGDGTVRAWGYNSYGQLGDGTTTRRSTPIQVSGLSGVSAIAAGRIHTVALKSDTTICTWGNDEIGQLGVGFSTVNTLASQVIWLDVAAPIGSVTISNGAAYTATEDVTLTLSATDDNGTVSQMRISNDGIFDTEPLEDYVSTKSWTLPPGDGLKSVYVRFRSSSGSESDIMTDTIMLDTSPPFINSVTVSPSIAAEEDSLRVVVDATDFMGVSSITADGVTLTKTGAITWSGYITAGSPPGGKIAIVSAADVLGHAITNSTGTYTVASILGITRNCLSDPIMASASSRWLFRVWGKVSIVDSNSFDLDNGSGTIIRVITPSYSGIANGDYVSARGILNVSASPVTLTCGAEYVIRYN